MRGLDKLEERAVKARLSREGLSKQRLLALQNALLPKGQLQERVFPLSHFLDRFGPGFVQAVSCAGELDDFGHHVLTLESGDA